MSNLIVYVDDDYEDIMLLRDAFAAYPHYEIITLQNGNFLYRLLEERASQVCLIILDINMPAINGIDLLKWLKENPKFKDIPVVMLSTSRNEKEVSRVKDLGSDIVVKPSTFHGIKTLASRLLEYC